MTTCVPQKKVRSTLLMSDTLILCLDSDENRWMLNPQFSGGFELDMNRFITPSTPLSLVIVYFLWISLVCSILVGSRLSLYFGSLCDLIFDYLITFCKYKHLIYMIFIVRLIVSPVTITCKRNQSEHLGRYKITFVFTEWDGQTYNL